MSRAAPAIHPAHSAAWVAQTWLSFGIAVAAMLFGTWHLPVDGWVRAFMALGLLFSIGSTFSLAKTLRDNHEMERLGARLDEARVNRLLTEHDPLQPPKF